MRNRRSLFAAVALLFATASLGFSLPEISGKVSPARLANLSRGINLDNYFSAYSDPQHFRFRLNAEDFALIKRMGFTFCRLPMDPGHFFDEAHPDRLRPAIRYVDKAVSMILASGLSVMVDPIHTSSVQPSFDERLATDPGFAEKVAIYWQAIARRYAHLDANRVFFEIMNEPHSSAYGHVTSAWWPPVQERFARAIRAVAPDNTLVATGEKWGGIDGLVAIRPLPDPNVVYSFHYYEPLTFTHQGASWAGKARAELSDIPYPSSPDAVRAALARLADPHARALLTEYGRERWNITTIRAWIRRAVEWGRRWDVPILCGEFGVYKKVAPPEARDRWIRDVRTVLEEYHIGWAMWDYDEGFGIVSYAYPGAKSGRIIDDRALEALGLRPIHPSREPSPISLFAERDTSELSLPIAWWSPLWTRDHDGGNLLIASAAGPSEPTTLPTPPLPAPPTEFVARIDHSGAHDWAVGSGLSLPVRTGERYRLQAWAWIEGSGSCTLQAVAYDAVGRVVSWSLGSVSPERQATWVALTSDIVVPPGVAKIEPRWSGAGPAVMWLTGMTLVRE